MRLFVFLLLSLVLWCCCCCVCVCGAFVATDTYTNPVVDQTNVPDPGVLYHNNLYYAVTTSGNAADKFPIRTSHDLVNWTLSGFVFPNGSKGTPKWGVSDFWAPEIHFISDKQFNVYFAARNSNGTLCVGVATGPSPLGPFTDIGEPLVDTPGMGNIDASFFRDGEKDYVMWKRDGNGAFPPVPTPIFIQQIINNGTVRTGQAYQAITNDQSWEGVLVEGPWVVKHNDTYYMFYSANGFTSPKYAIGVGRSKNITGPYEKLSTNPILHKDSAISANTFVGPGHCSVVQTHDAKKWYVIYHAWHRYKVGGSNNRVMLIDEVMFGDDGWPFVATSQPSFTPTPMPQT
eukprot:m.243029 g.243029  ORF g.243029 m.243029 type:complete len:345 (+) comp39807_c0_seq1:8-1042(+)